MPFKSLAQKGFLWANHPEIAARWSREYGAGTNLPSRVSEHSAPPGRNGRVHRNQVALEQYLGAGSGKQDARRRPA